MLIEYKVTELFHIYDSLCKDLERKLFRILKNRLKRILNNPYLGIDRSY